MKRFSNILFVADPVADDSAALAQALALASNNQAKLTVVGIVDVSEKDRNAADEQTRRVLEAMVEQRSEELEALLRDAANAATSTETRVLVGTGFLEVIREVLRHDRDLVIKSAQATGKLAQLFGSTDMKLLRKCPCPVWLIKSTAQRGYREILAALNYDPDDAEVNELNDQILEMASSLALSEFAELHVVHAWRLPHEKFWRSARSGLSDAEVDEMARNEEDERRAWLESLTLRHCEAQGKEAAEYLRPQFHLLNGSADQLVPELAESLGAELIVMGTVSRAGIPGLVVGNTAENILRQIRCSALTVKPRGFVSPVTV